MAEIWEPLSTRTFTECNSSQLPLTQTTAVPKYYVKFIWQAPDCGWLLDTTVDLSLTLKLTWSETWVMFEFNSLLSEYVGKCNTFIHILIVFDWLINICSCHKRFRNLTKFIGYRTLPGLANCTWHCMFSRILQRCWTNANNQEIRNQPFDSGSILFWISEEYLDLKI